MNLFFPFHSHWYHELVKDQQILKGKKGRRNKKMAERKAETKDMHMCKCENSDK